MSELFDAKIFNPEVFQRYIERVPNLHLNSLINSRAIVSRPELAASMSDQVGGNYLVTPLKGLIGGDPLNYDGVTDITSTSTQTFQHSRVVAGRAKAWTEKDFSYDITGGVDFMENVAQQVSEYWDEQNQLILLAILRGLFAMTGSKNEEFVERHTHDIKAITNTEGMVGRMDATTLNTAMQKASGDHKSKFNLVMMHSAVATNLENQNLLTYVKYNDANGMERDTNIATLNGRTVIIDDDMPVDTTGDDPVYTTYVLGDGAFEYTDCGAKVPYEMDRDPAKNGGEDTLYTRQRKCFSPWGISFTKKSMATLSPTTDELATGANWELVNTKGTSNKDYINHRAIGIARIVSLG